MPIRAYLGHALAHLGWTPPVFWEATMHEFQAAQEAHERANEAARKAAEGRK